MKNKDRAARCSARAEKARHGRRPPGALRIFLLACIAASMVTAGCTDDSAVVNRHQLNLNMPEVDGRQVTVNGGVVAPIERIQWEWGDGQTVPHHFFPASHTYDKAGQYEIRVTVFDSKNRTSTKSVSVVIN